MSKNPITLPHYSSKLGCRDYINDDDDVTVITSNTSRSDNTDDEWLNIDRTPKVGTHESSSRVIHPIAAQYSGVPANHNTAIHEISEFCKSFQQHQKNSTAYNSALTSQNYYHALQDDDTTRIVVDSGASDGFGDIDTPGTDRRPTEYGITMASATGDCRTSIATDKFDLPLPTECLDYHVFKQGDIKRPLLSVGKACDAGCEVVFNKTQCQFSKDGQPLLTAYRSYPSGLYLLPSKHPVTRNDTALLRHSPSGLSAYEITHVPQLMKYLHACAGFPSTDTWIDAINHGYYQGWPGLTAARVRKHLPKSEETTMGHMKLTRQNVRSTSKGEQGTIAMATPGRQTAQDLGRKRHVQAHSIPMKDIKGIMGTDQTGRFPVTSQRGHKYIFILADTDCDFIHGVPITSRKTSELVRAFEEAYTVLTTCGFEPVLNRTDNETSGILTDAIVSQGLQYELVPPGNHRNNPAERGIQTFKSHFISILNGVDPNYPADAWDHLIPQTNMTLNMLRKCGVNQNHSAYSYIHGPFNFDAHPLAPLGCRAIVHQRATGRGGKRGGWDNRGKIGYYVGPEMKSYRVWKFYMPGTNSIQRTDTAQFFPQIEMPTVSIAGQIEASLDTIKNALTDPSPAYTNIGDMHERNRLDAVVKQLRTMYSPDDLHTAPDSTSPTRAANGKSPKFSDDTSVPRVSDTKGTDTYSGINSYRPKKKQRFPIGTRVRVVEKRKGGREVFIGKAEEYDPYTGIYRVVFPDEEYEEFDNDEMEYFQLIKPRVPAKPSTYANQLTVTGYNPKAGPLSSKRGSTGDAKNQLGYADERSTNRLTYADEVVHALNAGSIYDEELHKWMAYRDLIKHPNKKIRDRWIRAGINEFARLTQGHGDIEGLDVVTFIPQREMPKDKKATYARYVVDYRPEKDEPWRLRITCGGDKLDYVGDTTTHSASMEVIKLQLNSIVSTVGAKCATGDISNMYLNSDLPEAEYVRFRMDLIPAEYASAHNLYAMVAPDGFIYARVNKAWYGLKQAGRIAHDDLVAHLAKAGYKKNDIIEGYFRHEDRDIDFTLVVDDFLIKYTDDRDLEHLQETIGAHYKFKVDLTAHQYVGINLKWNYNKRTVRLSMDGYVRQALMELEHEAPNAPHHSPSRYTLPKYGSRVQYAKVDESAVLTKDKVTFVQRAIGKLLYYARAVDPTMLHAINDISLSAAKGTEATLDATMYLLNYAHTHPNAEIIYRASDMILHVDSDAAYLVAPEARSRAGGYQYLSNKEGTLFNGPVMVVAKVIKNVMASATEAELAALFMNAQEAVALRNCLTEMGYPQPATPLKTDNNTANGIINNTMKQKRSKAIDVRFYWLRDRVKQGQFYVFWDSGKNNLGDFYTKHHPPIYHKKNRPIHTYQEGLSPESLQGCIKIMNAIAEKKQKNLNSSGLLASLRGTSWMAGRAPSHYIL